MSDADYLMALELQKEFDRELNSERDFDAKPVQKRFYQKRARSDDEDLNNTCNLVHPQWETLDPTPDAQALFRAFDDKFFQGRLRCVCLEWSKRMYSCAGICYTRRNRLGMAVTIRLSEPLLKLRPRKDLIETLLHEMIHAYCSVLGIREGNGGHGPNFRKIMNGINKVAGTNITVYHNFYDEVDVYKTHWWRCNGICQNRKPFYGYVKRTSNRAPGPNDIWWRQHLESCGGTFLKIKQPENKRTIKKDKKENAAHSGSDLRKFFPVDNKTSPNTFKGPVKSNGGGTLVLNSKTVKTISSSVQPKTSTPSKAPKSFGNLKNVVGFKDLESNVGRTSHNETIVGAITGVGYSLSNTNNSQNSSNKKSDEDRKVDREKLRDIWAKKQFSPSQSEPSSNKNSEKNQSSNEAKRRRLSQESETEPEVISYDIEEDKHEDQWKIVDDEIMIKEDLNPVIDISSDEEDGSIERPTEPPKPTTVQSADERQKQIKQEIMDSSEYDLSEDDIEIVDDEYDDNFVNLSAEIADTSLVDDLFGEDTLLKEFRKENAVSSNSLYHSDPRNDIISCPVCQDKIKREQFSEHIDGCVGITIRVNPMPSTSKSKKVTPFYKKQPKKKVTSNEIAQTLKNAGYESDELDGIIDSNNSVVETDGRTRREGLDNSTHACPVCAQEVDVERINEHLDICLK